MVKPGVYTINPEEEKGKKGVDAGIFDEIPIKTDHADTDHIVTVEKGSSRGGSYNRRARCLLILVGTILVLAVGIAAVTMLFARCKSSHDEREIWAMDKAAGKFDHFKDNMDGFFGGKGGRHGDEDGSDSSEMDDDDDRRPHHDHDHDHDRDHDHDHGHGGRSSHEDDGSHHLHPRPLGSLHGDHGDGDRDGEDEGPDGGEIEDDGPK